MPKQFFGLLLFLAMALAFMGVALFLIGRDVYHLIYFVPANATVTAYTAPDPWAKQADRPGKIFYRYTLNNQEYDAHYPDYKFSMPRRTSAILARSWHVGNPITIYLDPSNPTQSTPEMIIESFPFGLFTFILPFFILGLGSMFPRLVATKFIAGTQMAGGPAFVIFTLLCATLSFIYMGIANSLSWPAAAALGAFLPTIIIPSLTLSSIKLLDRIPHPRRRSDATTALILSVFAIILMGVSASGLYLAAKAVIATYRARSWPITQATVTRAQLIEYSGKHISYHAGIRYAYRIEDTSYTSDRWMYSMSNTESQVQATARIAAYPPGTPITIHYDPANPAASVVDCNFTTEHYLATPFFLILVAGGILIVYAAIKQWHTALSPFEKSIHSVKNKKNENRPSPIALNNRTRLFKR